MAKSYEQIQRQIESLQAEADRIRRKEVDEVIGRIRQAIDHYGITAADLGLAVAKAIPKARKGPVRKKAGRKAAAKKVAYRNESGQTWAGRGKRPQWLHEALASGRKLEEFKVSDA